MTKHMANAMNIPTLEEALKQQGIELPSREVDTVVDDETKEIDPSVLSQLEAAENMAKRITDFGGEDHERSMDTIYTETLAQAKELVELGHNMDQRGAARMFEVAATFYGHAMNAKNSKREAQLKLMRLALDQRKVDIAEKQVSDNVTDAEVSGVVVIGDRNDILKKAKEIALSKKT